MSKVTPVPQGSEEHVEVAVNVGHLPVVEGGQHPEAIGACRGDHVPCPPAGERGGAIPEPAPPRPVQAAGPADERVRGRPRPMGLCVVHEQEQRTARRRERVPDPGVDHASSGIPPDRHALRVAKDPLPFGLDVAPGDGVTEPAGQPRGLGDEHVVGHAPRVVPESAEELCHGERDRVTDRQPRAPLAAVLRRVQAGEQASVARKGPRAVGDHGVEDQPL